MLRTAVDDDVVVALLLVLLLFVGVVVRRRLLIFVVETFAKLFIRVSLKAEERKDEEELLVLL